MKDNNHPMYGGKHLDQILHQVPVDYYQSGVKSNSFQRIWHTNKLKNVLAMIKLASFKPKKILDVGCASGWFLSEVSRAFPKASCHGVDLYKEAISYGSKRYKKLHLKQADAHILPFDDSVFDTIICCEVLEHVENPKQVLKEIRRVMTSDGSLVVEIDSGNFLFKLVWYWWTSLKKGVWVDAHVHSFNIDKLNKLFEESGLTLVRKKTFNSSMGVVFLLKKRIIEDKLDLN